MRTDEPAPQGEPPQSSLQASSVPLQASNKASTVSMLEPQVSTRRTPGLVSTASDLATFITGEILNVNGGAVLCG